MRFSEEDKLRLLQLAQESIMHYVNKNERFSPSASLDYSPLNSLSGAFVSIYHADDLRGCLGRFKSDISLYLLIARLAVSAASKDHRFTPVSIEELEKISVEISVLSPLQQIQHANEIIIGKHGIYMKHGCQRGTLLPQVAVKNGWNNIELLEFCAQHKTGIGKNQWKDAELFTYEAVIFNNK